MDTRHLILKHKFMNKKILYILIALFAGAAIYLRLAEHPANFTPVAGLALFAGAYLSKRWSLALPLAIMFLSDLFLGFYEWQLMLAVYGSIALAAVIGWRLKKSKNLVSVIGGSLAASLAFFIVTNMIVWAFSPWYDKNLIGFLECYAMAIPFFRNTMLGDLFFVGATFGSYELVRYYIKIRGLITAEARLPAVGRDFRR